MENNIKDILERFRREFSTVGWHPDNKKRLEAFLEKELSLLVEKTRLEGKVEMAKKAYNWTQTYNSDNELAMGAHKAGYEQCVNDLDYFKQKLKDKENE